MLEGNKGKLNVAVIFLILTVIIIGVMGAYIYLEKDKSDKKIGELENKIQNIETTVQKGIKEEEARKLAEKKEEEKKKNIILFCDMNFANASPGTYYGSLRTEKYPEFYNTTYDVYRKGEKIGENNGNDKKETWNLDGEETIGYRMDFEDANPYEIYVSCNYNVVPRKYTEVEDIPEEIENDFTDCISIKVQSIDLDGDNKTEYVVGYEKEGEERTVGTTGISLYDFNYNKVSDLATISTYYELENLERVNYIDVDNDGIMEILVNLTEPPESYICGLYKYNKGNLEGQLGSFSTSP